MTKPTSTKSSKSNPAPGKLAKLGGKSGVELSETELSRASGGVRPIKVGY
jgi:hypothetical protein